MIFEIDSHHVIIGLMCGNMVLGLWRCVADWRMHKKLKWLVDVLQREAAYERV
jgi:hypothetical protein